MATLFVEGQGLPSGTALWALTCKRNFFANFQVECIECSEMFRPTTRRESLILARLQNQWALSTTLFKGLPSLNRWQFSMNNAVRRSSK